MWAAAQMTVSPSGDESGLRERPVGSDRDEGEYSERRSPWRYVAPWYLAYSILGLVTSGMLPFLLPLMISTTTNEPSRIGYTIGAYNAGLLPAPLLGLVAERFGLFRPVFFGGFGALSVGLAAAP